MTVPSSLLGFLLSYPCFLGSASLFVYFFLVPDQFVFLFFFCFFFFVVVVAFFHVNGFLDCYSFTDS